MNTTMNTTETPVEMVDDVTLLRTLITEAETAQASAQAKLEAMTMIWPSYRTTTAFQLSVLISQYNWGRDNLEAEVENFGDVLDHLRQELEKATAAAGCGAK